MTGAPHSGEGWPGVVAPGFPGMAGLEPHGVASALYPRHECCPAPLLKCKLVIMASSTPTWPVVLFKECRFPSIDQNLCNALEESGTSPLFLTQ